MIWYRSNMDIKIMINGSLIAFVNASTSPVLIWFCERFDIKSFIWLLSICIWLVDLKYLKLCKISIIYFAKLPFISELKIALHVYSIFEKNIINLEQALINPMRQVIINAKEMYTELIIEIPTLIKIERLNSPSSRSFNKLVKYPVSFFEMFIVNHWIKSNNLLFISANKLPLNKAT